MQVAIIRFEMFACCKSLHYGKYNNGITLGVKWTKLVVNVMLLSVFTVLWKFVIDMKMYIPYCSVDLLNKTGK